MSIARVAQAANVSYATAWRIINNQPCGSEEAIAAVREAMGQLGYDPTVGRRRGRKPRVADGIRTRNIALLHFRAATAISSSVLSCVHRMLAEKNLNLIFAHAQKVDALPPAVRSGQIDGILGYGQYPAEVVDRSLQKIPAVWMMTRWDGAADPWGDRVKPDHNSIGQLAAEYLLSRGHRLMAYFNPELGFALYQHRFQSFRMAAEGAGTSPAVFNSRGEHDDLNAQAEQCVEQWLQASPRPTGIFVPVDRVTLFVYRHLERRGIAIGKDGVDVVSCDNERELLSLMRPPPASIDLNRDMIARLAVERLLWRMKNGVTSPSVQITVSPTLATQEVN